ncbi:MAG TPA: NAD(P)H-hydrate dehydratase [Solirubrobacteraceae bacterium]|nr:NAD(P)H-hydrate dehydratase [Solirubrobacteraceae bacterium]
MTLPDWLDPLFDAESMRAIDRWAIEEQGVPSLDLMERAGEGLARLTEELVPEGRIAIVCGKGNNGGDGFVAGRLLRDGGREVDLFCTAPLASLKGDAQVNLERLPGDPPGDFAPGALASAVGVVDALLGTGVEGAPRDPEAAAIDAINAAELTVVAADVPSGVNASTGGVAGAAVRASATATFHAAKVGLWIAPGKQHAGRVEVIDIGIPGGAPREADVGLLRDSVLGLIPRRHAGSTKFTEGAVLVCGGSPGLTGAPCLSAEAASRAGAGYVTACVPASLEAIFEHRLLEVMTVGLDDDRGVLTKSSAPAVLERAERAQALVLGPGIGRGGEAQAFVRDLAARADLPLLLDADGLNAYAGRLSELAGRAQASVLTPHAGELARLLEVESSAVDAARLERARAASQTAASFVLLKGDDTLIAAPDGRVAVSRGGAGALATAGTGDVLSGVLGALLAKRMDPWEAACAAVVLHADAGRIAGERQGTDSVIARDVIDALPAARARRS